MVKYSNLVLEINRLLGMRFIYGNISSKTPIGQSLIDIINFNNKGEYIIRDYEFSRLRMFVKHLQEIERYDIHLFKKFKKKIHIPSEYFGARFEINIAASLFRKKVKFSKTESPDFTIQNGERDIFIECGSTHLSQPKLGDIKNKIISVIDEKSKEEYSNPDTALFIDVTNIFHYMKKHLLPTQEEIKNDVKNTLESTNFGNVTLFTYMMNQDSNRFESIYQRINNKNTNKALQNFLDQYYPFGKFVVFNFFIPSQG